MKGAKYSIGRSRSKIVLADHCDACAGEGKLDNKECKHCDGFGYFITEDGSQILALVKDILLKNSKTKS